ncbi:Mitogen-activated protein kinase hog1b, partial [Tricholoma furcatifolium]
NPSNIIVNENCDLRICDFDLARIDHRHMSGCGSTLYYCAPEVFLTWQRYGKEHDIWSTGCIFAEMLEGKPLFPGKDAINQYNIITQAIGIGTPPDDVIETICSEDSLPKRERVPFSQKLRTDDPD